MVLPFIDLQLPLSKLHATTIISRLVEAVVRAEEPAYTVTPDASGGERVKPTSLSRLFDYVPQISEAYADRCDDEHQAVFWTAYQEIGLERSPFGLVCMNISETGYLSTAQSMNALVDRIRQLICCQELDQAVEWAVAAGSGQRDQSLARILGESLGAIS